MIVVVMGIAGAGKTRVGTALAHSLGWPFFDADDFHPPPNLARMTAGVPLTDEDREPWLHALQQLIASVPDAVLACSALREAFRKRLAAAAPDLVFVYLRVDPALAEHRMRTREGHFMPPSLMASQVDALQVPEDAIEVDGAMPVEAIVAQIIAERRRLGGWPGGVPPR
jgi:gluconokinase